MEKIIHLPEPDFRGSIPVEIALLKRRSVRKFSNKPLTLKEISQLLWALQGITHFEGFRTAPSAGALYPLEIYLVIFSVEKLTRGVYKYNPYRHEIELIKIGDFKTELFSACLGQEWVIEGAVSFIITGIYDRTTGKYGSRGIRYVDMEAGHSAQNLLLQATGLGLGCVPVGAFYDNHLRRIIEAKQDVFPLYVIPCGRLI